MEKLYDAIIVGGGPAGLSAAIYMARAQFKVLVVEKETIGGQITITSDIVNYPGVVKTDGATLTKQMKVQAENFGAEFLISKVNKLELEGDYKVVHTDVGSFKALSVIYAAGAHPKRAEFEGEDEFRGHGVAYCATCDGEFFTDKDIFVIGGGFSAVEEALFLTRYAKSITVVVRRDKFSISSAEVEELINHPKVTVMYNTRLKSVQGDNSIRKVVLKNNVTEKETAYKSFDKDFFGVFVFIGYEPENSLVKGLLELNAQGYVVTDRNQETNIKGVYAAGDICIKNLRQVVTAVSDGAIAATSAEKYLGIQYRKLNLERTFVKPKTQNVEEKNVPKASSNAFLDDNMRKALVPVFDKFENQIVLRVYTDDSKVSRENTKIVNEITSLCEKIKSEFIPVSQESERYMISICSKDGADRGLRFHGIPGGHEFNSFVLAMYNVAGPGQNIGEEASKRIANIKKSVKIQIAVSLSCTMCPDLVAAAQRIASENTNVTVDVHDLQYYPQMREKYNIMSVPCMIINGEEIHFGKKNLSQILDILGV